MVPDGVVHWDVLQVIPDTSQNDNTMFCARTGLNPPSSTTEALDFIKGLLEMPGCTVAHPESEFLSRLESVVREADARGNLIFDAQIAALCREQGIGTIVTNDRDFARFRPLQASYLGAGT